MGFKSNNKGVLMKKLMMFAAAMTIVGGAYASSCGDCTDDCSCSLVYDFKASLKTTLPKDASTSCSELCYRKCGSVSLKGYFYLCGSCTCDSFAQMLFVAIDKKSKDFVVGSSEEGVAPTWTILNHIGKKDSNIEALWSIEGNDGWTWTAAGCGTFDLKNDRVKSISGSLVGQKDAPACAAAACEDSGSVAVAYPLCTVDATTDATIVYGTWSMKYNSGKSKKGCTCSDTIPDLF